MSAFTPLLGLILSIATLSSSPSFDQDTQVKFSKLELSARDRGGYTRLSDRSLVGSAYLDLKGNTMRYEFRCGGVTFQRTLKFSDAFGAGVQVLAFTKDLKKRCVHVFSIWDATKRSTLVVAYNWKEGCPTRLFPTRDAFSIPGDRKLFDIIHLPSTPPAYALLDCLRGEILIVTERGKERVILTSSSEPNMTKVRFLSYTGRGGLTKDGELMRNEDGSVAILTGYHIRASRFKEGGSLSVSDPDQVFVRMTDERGDLNFQSW